MSILKREIIYPGKTDPGVVMTDSKMTYHFKTVVYRSHADTTSNPIVIDDSRVIGPKKPMETVYGKEFKLPIWESCLSAMRCGEVCRLTVKDDPTTHYICLNYVVVSKIYRKYCGLKATHIEPGSECQHDGGHGSHRGGGGHNCYMNFHRSPYKDLNDLVTNPPEIFEFTFELISVQPPQDYERDTWQLSAQEKYELLPRLREDGNRHYGECNYDRALRAYEKALSILDTLAMEEKPKSDEWARYDRMKIPFFLNIAQVKLAQSEFYECIRCCSEVLNRDCNNIKAYYRRAKAHAGVWNVQDARNDYARCLELDPSARPSIVKMLNELSLRERMKNNEDRRRLKALFNEQQKQQQIQQLQQSRPQSQPQQQQPQPQAMPSRSRKYP